MINSNITDFAINREKYNIKKFYFLNYMYVTEGEILRYYKVKSKALIKNLYDQFPGSTLKTTRSTHTN